MVRIAVIGAGPWGINHVRVVANEAGCALASVADPDPQARERVRLMVPRVRICSDADQVLADPSVDAVIIASPAHTHAALVCSALASGKHVLVEKPLAMRVCDALAVEGATRRHQRVVMVGHLLVHHPAVLRLRELLESGTLGRVHYVHSTRANLGRIRRDENALWSFGPHDLSIIDLLLAGMPETVSARGQSVLQPGVEDVVFMTLRYASGEMAHVHLSWLHPRKERRVTLVCSHKMVEFDDVSSEKLRVFDKGYDRPPEFTEYAQYLTLRDGDVHIPRIEMQEPLRLQLQHFVDCIRSGRRPVADVDSGVRIVRILEAAQRSLAADGIPCEILESRA